MKISSCCGVEPYSNGDASTEDYGICPACKDRCEYEEIDDELLNSEQNAEVSDTTDDHSSNVDDKINS